MVSRRSQIRESSRPPEYRPPPLTIRVRLRNPSENPNTGRDAFGRPDVTDEDWGTLVWAARRDRAPRTLNEEGIEVHSSVVVFTIRERPGISPDVEIVHDGQIFESIGPGVARGGPGTGRLSRYLEIHTQLRT